MKSRKSYSPFIAGPYTKASAYQHADSVASINKKIPNLNEDFDVPESFDPDEWPDAKSRSPVAPPPGTTLAEFLAENDGL